MTTTIYYRPPRNRWEWLLRYLQWRMDRPRFGEYNTKKAHGYAIDTWRGNRP